MFEENAEGDVAIQQQEPVQVEQETQTPEPPKEDPKPEPEKESGYKRLKRQLDKARQEIDALKNQTPAKPEPTQTKGKPNYDDYAAQGKTAEEYFEDLADWKADQKIQDALSKREAQAKETELKRERDNQTKSYADKAESLRTQLPDYDEVIEAYDGPYNPTIAQALLDSNNPEIAYYLAKNPEEADKLEGMNYAQVNRFFGRVEAKLENRSKPAEVKTTQAPPPIKPVGTTAKGEFDPYSSKGFSHEAYLRWREQNAN